MVGLQPMYPGQTNSPLTTTLGALTEGQTTINVVDGFVLPDAPNLLVLDRQKPNAETVLMTAKEGNTLTVIRGWDNSIPQSWPAGTDVSRVFTAADLNTLQANVNILNEKKAAAADLSAVASTGFYADLLAVPEAFNPITHAASHSTGGTDELTPMDIGAERAGAADSAVAEHDADVDAHSELFVGKEDAGTAASTVSTHDSSAEAHSSLFGAKLDKAGGKMAGSLIAQDNPSNAEAQTRNIIVSDTDLTAGTSSLANGVLYCVYE